MIKMQKEQELETNNIQLLLKQHRDIIHAAIDYLIESTTGHFKLDGFDPYAHYYQKLKEKTEKHYRGNNLEGLKKVLRKIIEERAQVSDLFIGSYIKGKTGNEVDMFGNLVERINSIIEKGSISNEKEYRDAVVIANVLRQTAADPGRLATIDRLRRNYDEQRDNRQLKSSKQDQYFSNQISNIVSPNRKHRLIVLESGINKENAVTQVSLNTPNGGAGVYVVKGIYSGIKAYWKDNQSIIIETKKDYEVQSQCRQLQIFNDVFSIEVIES